MQSMKSNSSSLYVIKKEQEGAQTTTNPASQDPGLLERGIVRDSRRESELYRLAEISPELHSNADSERKINIAEAKRNLLERHSLKYHRDKSRSCCKFVRFGLPLHSLLTMVIVSLVVVTQIHQGAEAYRQLFYAGLATSVPTTEAQRLQARQAALTIYRNNINTNSIANVITTWTSTNKLVGI
jgi:hypothetical protein